MREALGQESREGLPRSLTQFQQRVTLVVLLTYLGQRRFLEEKPTVDGIGDCGREK